MNKNEIIQGSGGRFLFVGSLDQTTIPEFWQQRSKLVAENKDIVIDLASVTHSDSAGLGFLTCLQSEAIHSQQQLSFINIPQQLLKLIKLSRLEDVLNYEQQYD